LTQSFRNDIEYIYPDAVGRCHYQRFELGGFAAKTFLKDVETMAEAIAPESHMVVLIDVSSDCREKLTVLGYDVKSYVNCEGALAVDPDVINPSAIIVDVALGSDQGRVNFIAALRQKWPFAPLLTLVDDTIMETASESLAAGACDYLIRPIDPVQLDSRLQVRISEYRQRSAKDSFSIGDIQVDAGHRIIFRDDRKRVLSPTEMNLLHCLATAKGTIVNREVMKRRCWGQAEVSDNALNRKLHEVRRALSSLSAQVSIKTIYGTGFLLEVKNN
jgi:DNA-binding response OmpR family regulator